MYMYTYICLCIYVYTHTGCYCDARLRHVVAEAEHDAGGLRV